MNTETTILIKENLNLALTITRLSTGRIRLSIKDPVSCITFLKMELLPEDFMNCLTGLAYQPGIGVVYGTEFLGKTKQIEERTIEMPLQNTDFWSSKEYSIWLKNNYKEEGWFIDTYLGSKNSIEYKEGKQFLNFTVYRYI